MANKNIGDNKRGIESKREPLPPKIGKRLPTRVGNEISVTAKPPPPISNKK